MKFKKLYLTLFCFSLVNFTFSQEIRLPHLFTFIDSPVVEQRQVLTHEEIEESKACDLPELLTSAGIQLLSYGPYGLNQNPSIRGFTDETVRVVIDGICVNNAQYGTFDFSSINVDNIEKIEIVRGGFTEGVSDEGAVGGVIYITTKKQQLGTHFFGDFLIKSFFNANLPFDTFIQSGGFNAQTGENTFIKANGKIAWANNKYIYVNYKNGYSERKNAEVLDGNANLNFLHYFGNGNSFSINELFYGGDKNTPGTENSKNPGNQKDFNNNLTMQLIQPEFKPGIRLENSLCWLGNLRFYDDSLGSSKHNVNSAKYAGVLNLYKWDNFSEDVGLTFDYTHLNSSDDGIHDQFSGTLKSTAKYSKNGFNFSLPLAAKFCNQNFAFTPKVGTGYKTEYLDIFIDAYKMTQFPNMDDLYWDSNGYHGNPNLKPENGWGGDCTINIHNVWFPVSVCFFSNYYKNKIQWANTNGIWGPQNIASAFYFGVDANFEKSFLQDRISIRGNGEYLYTRLLDKSNKTYYGNKIMWTPDFTAAVTTNFKLPATEKFPATQLAIETTYMGKRYVSNANISFLEPYLLINLSGEMEFKIKKAELKPYFRFDNLLNTSYQSVENYPMPGISLTLGIKLNGF